LRIKLYLISDIFLCSGRLRLPQISRGNDPERQTSKEEKPGEYLRQFMFMFTHNTKQYAGSSAEREGQSERPEIMSNLKASPKENQKIPEHFQKNL
jgi:hypothetical protein